MQKLRFICLLCIMIGLFASPADGKTRDEIDMLIQQGISACDAEKYVEAVRMLTEARKVAQQEGWNEAWAKASYNLGVCYFNVAENVKALNYFTESLQLCNKKNLGWRQKSLSMNAIAGVYFSEERFDKAQEIVRECHNEALRQNDSASVVTYAINLALVCNRRHQPDSAIAILQKAKQFMLKDDKKHDKEKMETVWVESAFQKKNYRAAAKMARELLQEPNVMGADKTIMRIYLIHIAFDQGRFDEARALAEETEKTASITHKPELYGLMSQIAERNKLPEKALRYRDSIIIYRDSLARMQNRRLTQNGEVRVEMLQLEADADKRMAQVEHHKQLYLFGLCIVGLVAGILILGLQMRRIKDQRRIEIAETKMKETELAASYRQELMKKSLEQQQKELSTVSMLTAQRNKLIENILKSLEKSEAVSNDPALRKLMDHLKEQLHNSVGLDDLVVKVTSAAPDLATKLQAKHPDLSVSDIRFLSLIHLNLSNKEMAGLLNISPDSCKKRRMRIAKKLHLDSAADILAYLQSL